jgi:hypothetical protein
VESGHERTVDVSAGDVSPNEHHSDASGKSDLCKQSSVNEIEQMEIKKKTH